MTRGKVLLVSFPFDDLSGTKVRPAVCLTEPVGPHRHVVLAFITSQVPPVVLDTDIVLRPGDAGFAPAGLRLASAIRLHRLMTVSTRLVQRELGALAREGRPLPPPRPSAERYDAWVDWALAQSRRGAPVTV